MIKEKEWKLNINFTYQPAPPSPYFSKKYDKSLCLPRYREAGDIIYRWCVSVQKGLTQQTWNWYSQKGLLAQEAARNLDFAGFLLFPNWWEWLTVPRFLMQQCGLCWTFAFLLEFWYMPDRRCLYEQLTGKTLGTVSLMGLTWGESSHICYCLHCWRKSVFCVAPHEVDRAYGSLHLGASRYSLPILPLCSKRVPFLCGWNKSQPWV